MFTPRLGAFGVYFGQGKTTKQQPSEYPNCHKNNASQVSQNPFDFLDFWGLFHAN
jgi:hypothetical protein